MSLMSVTPEVSQSSGWLKARAPCRGSQAGHTVRGGLRAGGVGRRRGQARCARLQIWGGGARGAAHVKDLVHVRDAGSVPAQGLVEGVRVLPRVASRAHGAGRAAGREPGGGGRERGVHAVYRGEGTRSRLGAGRGEQRTLNMRDMSVTRDVSQLRGWLKARASCRGSQAGHTVRGGLRAGRREAAGERGIRSVQGRGARDCRYRGAGGGEQRT